MEHAYMLLALVLSRQSALNYMSEKWKVNPRALLCVQFLPPALCSMQPLPICRLAKESEPH